MCVCVCACVHVGLCLLRDRGRGKAHEVFCHLRPIDVLLLLNVNNAKYIILYRLRDTVCSLIFMKNITFLFFVQDPGMHAFNFTVKKSCISL